MVYLKNRGQNIICPKDDRKFLVIDVHGDETRTKKEIKRSIEDETKGKYAPHGVTLYPPSTRASIFSGAKRRKRWKGKEERTRTGTGKLENALFCALFDLQSRRVSFLIDRCRSKKEEMKFNEIKTFIRRSILFLSTHPFLSYE